MPGLAASSKIFENIKLPADLFEMHFMEWLLPLKKESISDYCDRLIAEIKHENPVLVGVSFGGILVQEIAKKIPVQKVIVISSVLSSREFPKRLKWAKSYQLYHLFPATLFSNMNVLKYLMRGKHLSKRWELYNTFMSVNQKEYLTWAVRSVVCWKESGGLDVPVVRIHGDRDDVFPIKNIDTADSLIVENGTHAMIVYKYKWFNSHLPELILNK